MKEKVQQVIDRLKGVGGESYDGNGRHGWRNPIRDDTGGLLEAFVIAHRPKNILEIGTAYGLSGMYLAGPLDESGFMDTIEFDQVVANTAQQNFDQAGLRVRVHTGDALSVIRSTSLRGHYNLVFFDAEKRSYLKHLHALIDNELLEPGCVILADNVIDRKEECQNFLDWFENNNMPFAILETKCGLLIGKIVAHNEVKEYKSHWTTCPVGCCDDSIDEGKVYF